MKLTVHAYVTLDGVMQAPNAPEEDTADGFDRGGWMAPFAGEDVERIANGWFEQTDVLLYGRGTYDAMATFWPNITDPDDRAAATINAAPKYLVSTSVVDPRWDNTVDIFTDDVTGQIAALKEQSGRELQVHGSWQLVQTLHQAELVDEYRIVEFPVVVGGGKRLFDDGAPPLDFTVVHTEVLDSGAVYRVLQPASFQSGDSSA